LVRGEETVNPSGWRAWPLCHNVSNVSFLPNLDDEGYTDIILELSKDNEGITYATSVFPRRIDAW